MECTGYGDMLALGNGKEKDEDMKKIKTEGKVVQIACGGHILPFYSYKKAIRGT